MLVAWEYSDSGADMGVDALRKFQSEGKLGVTVAPLCYRLTLQAEIGHCLKQCRAEGLDREAVLFRLATSVEGVYVPQFYEAPRGYELGGASAVH